MVTRSNCTAPPITSPLQGNCTEKSVGCSGMKPEVEVLTVTWVKAKGVRVVTLSSYDTSLTASQLNSTASIEAGRGGRRASIVRGRGPVVKVGS